MEGKDKKTKNKKAKSKDINSSLDEHKLVKLLVPRVDVSSVEEKYRDYKKNAVALTVKTKNGNYDIIVRRGRNDKSNKKQFLQPSESSMSNIINAGNFSVEDFGKLWLKLLEQLDGQIIDSQAQSKDDKNIEDEIDEDDDKNNFERQKVKKYSSSKKNKKRSSSKKNKNKTRSKGLKSSNKPKKVTKK